MIEPLFPPAANTLPPDDIAGPISPWQIMKQAGRLYRRHGPDLITLAGVGYGGLLLALLLYLALSALLSSVVPAATVLLLAMFWLGVVGSGVVIVAAYAFVTAAMTISLTGRSAGLPVSNRAAITAAWQARSGLLTALVVVLMAALALVIIGGIPVVGWLIAPGGLVALGCLAALLPVVVMVEEAPGLWAVARTWSLLRGHFFRTTGLISALATPGILLLALPTLAMLALNLPFQLADGWLPLLPGLFYLPWFAAGVILTYFDLRARGEWAQPAKGVVTAIELGRVGVVTVATVVVAGLFAAAGWGILTAGPMALDSWTAGQVVGQKAPDFTLTRLEGGSLALADLRGQPIVINFWATWCPPCLEELPALQAAYLAHRDEINFVAISVKEESGVVAQFITQHGITLPVLLDSNGAAVDLYGVRGLPTTVFIDKQGVVVDRHLGGLDPPTLNTYLAGLLAE